MPSSIPSSPISKVVTKLFDQDNHSLDTYKRFLLLSSQSNEDIKKHFPLRISGSSRYSTEVEVNREKVYNSSLKLIFLFYARLQQTDTGDFDEKAVSNETISKMELTAFCRDFKLIPKLLSVKDINFIWQGMEAEWYVINKSQTFNSLGYDEFMDCLVRLAVFAYSKPGLQRLILNINGFKLSPQEKVEYFAKYLHLDDQNWVKHHIDTVGKQTQRNLYGRSEGENNQAIRQNLIDDHKAERLAIVFDKKDGSTVLGNNSSVLPRFDLSIHDDDGPVKEATSFGSKLLPKALFQVLYPNDVLDDETVRSTNNSLKQALLRRGSVFMNSMNTLNSIRATNDGGKIGYHGHASVKATHATGFDQLNERLSPTKNEPEKRQRGYKEVDMKINPAVLTDERLADYDASLSHIFARFGFFKPSSKTSDTVYSEGPFLDMGYLPIGTQCVARFQITNACANDLKIDVMAKGFHAKNTRVTTLPGALVPGLCRAVSVSFTVEPGPDKDHLALVEVICANICTRIINKITCPVFYRIRKEIPLVPSTICTVRNLPSLLNKFNGTVSQSNLTLDFLVKKEYWQRQNYFTDPPSPRNYAESQQLKTLKGAGVLKIGTDSQTSDTKRQRPSTAPNRRQVIIEETEKSSNNENKPKPILTRPKTASAARTRRL